MTITKRAIKDEQKLDRRQTIVDQAWAQFQTRSYDAINMIDIAQAAGLAKGTVYLYFPTKEALFLGVLEQQFAAWFRGVDAYLEAHSAIDAPTLAQFLTRSVTERPSLARLFAIAHVVLEHNISAEAARAYKHMLHEHMAHTGGLLEARLPRLHVGQGAHMLTRAYAIVIGVQHVTQPAPVVAQVIAEDPQLQRFQPRFEDELYALLIALLNAYETQLIA
jgi:AcrR family transcriptional regulator